MLIAMGLAGWGILLGLAGHVLGSATLQAAALAAACAGLAFMALHFASHRLVRMPSLYAARPRREVRADRWNAGAGWVVLPVRALSGRAGLARGIAARR